MSFRREGENVAQLEVDQPPKRRRIAKKKCSECGQLPAHQRVDVETQSECVHVYNQYHITIISVHIYAYPQYSKNIELHSKSLNNTVRTEGNRSTQSE
jgi:hypothetical protein